MTLKNQTIGVAILAILTVTIGFNVAYAEETEWEKI